MYFFESSSKSNPFRCVPEILRGKMALSAKFRNNVSQAHDQYRARESGADNPITSDALCEIEIGFLKIDVSLISDVNIVMRILDNFVLHLRPSRSIRSRTLHRIRLFNEVSLDVSYNTFNTYV